MPACLRPALLAVVALLIACAGSTARAQSAWSFSIGTGGYGHHHHGGWYGGYSYRPYWGPGWYGPGVVYAAPPPVIVQQPAIYVQPQQVLPQQQQQVWTAPAAAANVASAPVNSAPLASAPVTANALPGSTTEDDRIVIRNMAGAQLPVAFLVDGQDVELADGATRTFVGKPRRAVSYDRGGRFGSTEQQLAAGQYEFRITTSGWDLVRKPDLTPTGRTAIRTNPLPR